MRAILAILVFILTIVGIFYIAIWWGIVEPIIMIVDAINADAVTGSMVGWEVFKFLIKEVVAVFVGMVGFGLAGAIAKV